MKKIFSLLFFVALGCSFSYAGPYVVGVNPINDLLNKVEKGTGDDPPARVATTDEGPWRTLETTYGVLTITPKDSKFIPFFFQDPYLVDPNETAETSPNWLGILAVNFAGKGYKQIEGTVISLIQPSFDVWFYDGAIPDKWKNPWENDWNPTEVMKNWKDFWDRNTISYLESIDFSGNDFFDIEINGSIDAYPETGMPLKTLNLSNNPNLTSLSVTNCYQLELLDIRGTGLSAAAIEQIKADVLDASPNATILTGGAGIPAVNVVAPAVCMKGDMLYIQNKAPKEIVTVFDLSGRTLLKSANNAIDMSSFTNGVYLVKANNKVTKVLK